MSALDHKRTFPSVARVAAGVFGFLIFSHAFDGPDLYGELSLPIRSEKMIAPSQAIVTKNWLGTPVLMRANATFPALPLLRVSSDVVRARIAEATIARQNIASAVAIVERAILAVPIDTSFAVLDHRAPGGLGALRVSYRCKSSGSHQDRAYRHLQPPCRG